jgi:branched-chain amino acid aminotransferase
VSSAPFSAVFFEGRFVPEAEARVPITDRGYMLGEGVFATLRGYEGACFRPERHLATLARGAEAFGLELPVSLERLAAIADLAAQRSGAHDARVRVTLARGAEAANADKAVLSVVARAFELPSDDDYLHGIAVATVSARRVPPACMDGTVKTTSYAPALLALRAAQARGARDGLQLATDGSLACGTMANVFVVTGDTLLTPSLGSGCRAGVTREAILALAPAEGLEVREARIEPRALLEADEAFLTSTRIECLSIASVDGHVIGRPLHHPRASALRRALRALVERETAARRTTSS